MMAERDFWLSSGYRHLAPTATGQLAVSDDFLRKFFLLPELVPVEESCAAERALHAALLENPTVAVTDRQLADLADPDARENYRHVLSFRDCLGAHDTVEAAYMSLFKAGAVSLPPIFVDHLACVILRHILDGCDKPLRLRAAELLFRTQSVTLEGEKILLADANAAAARETGEFEVLGDHNSASYWAHSETFDTVLNVAFTNISVDALCRVLESWVAHLLGVEVRINPVGSFFSDDWAWHLGLDADANDILNDLYRQREVGEDRLARLICLFRLEFQDSSLMQERVRGRPVYMALSRTPDQRVRLKPQNLLLNLPLAAAA